jgi:type I restriction enzyme S subunit
MRVMKDSGVEWLGDIPEGWQVKPHWAFIKEKKVPVGNLHSELTLLSLTKQGVIVRDLEAGGKFPSNFEGYQQVAPNDLVLCLFDIEETPRTVGLAPTEGMITSAYTLMRVTGINPYFLEWYLIGMDNEKRFKPFYSGLRNTLQKPIFGSIRFAVPPSGEQAQIVDYLDKETSQIDALISKKEQLIEKLLERRQALITQVVTKGLDPNTPMKDSGVEWLGEIPSGWKIKRVSHVARRSNTKARDLPVVTAFRDGQVTLRANRRTDGFTEATEFHGYQRIQAGQVAVHRMDAFAGAIGVSDSDGMCSPVLTLLNCSRQVRPEYLAFFLREVSKSGWIEAIAKSVRERTSEFGWSELSSQLVALPGLAEQKQITAYLDKETSQIDTLVEKTRKAIELLKERRQALITQVVTGKIDVRGFAGGNS